jgi:hypothetical protein
MGITQHTPFEARFFLNLHDDIFMSYKPEEFFVGVIDLFAVLLPGAIFTAGVFTIAHPFADDTLLLLNTEPRKWVAFILAAYFFGHFLFLIGAALDYPYDWLRRKYIAKRNDDAYISACKLHQKDLGSHASALNTFQWANSYLQLQRPSGLSAIHRLEADSKFFRSLVVVLAIGAIYFFAMARIVGALTCLLLAFFSFCRYAERRWKSTQTAYQLMIVELGRSSREPPSSVDKKTSTS